MRILEEIKKEIIELIANCPGITENEIGKQLTLSPRFARKLFDQMVKNGEICLKV